MNRTNIINAKVCDRDEIWNREKSGITHKLLFMVQKHGRSRWQKLVGL